jgi:adenosylcobinamide-phosphate synthase
LIGFKIILAYLLDLVTGLLPGAPGGFPHPVKVIGSFVSAQESFYRKNFSSLLFAGGALAVVTVASVYMVSIGLEKAAFAVNPAAGFLIGVALVYFSISPEPLAREGAKIYRLLKSEDEEGARKELSMIVGRDTGLMTKADIIRACVETLAENSVDAVISPLFFAAIGGGPLAMAYRAVNTLDSMTGYRNEKYELLGKVSARLDDAANFFPARFSILVILAASFFLRYDAKGCLRTAMRDRLKHPSPNSAHPESAFAGALGIRLGGESYYGGVLKEKPFLGDGPPAYDAVVVARAVWLLRLTSLITCLFFACATYL